MNSCPNGVSGIYGIRYYGQWIYVGQSKNIRRRLANHDYREWFEKIPGGELFYCECKDRIRFEAILIRRHRPLLNNRGSHVHFLAIHEARGIPIKGAPRYLKAENNV